VAEVSEACCDDDTLERCCRGDRKEECCGANPAPRSCRCAPQGARFDVTPGGHHVVED
jgi:hypothetical protein